MFSMKIHTLSFLALALLTSPSALAMPFAAISGNQIFDLVPGSGQLTNPRTVTVGGSAITGSPIGLEFFDGSLWTVTSTLGPAQDQQILQISPTDGSATVIGTFNDLRLSEGGLAYDDATGRLLGALARESSTNFQLFEIQLDAGPDFGSLDLLGQIPFADFSGLAFDASGNLFGLNTSGSGSSLVQLDAFTGAEIGSVPIVDTLGAAINLELRAGIDLDPRTGAFVAGTFVNGSSPQLFEIDPTTGVATQIDILSGTGSTSVTGIAFVPEPSTALLFGSGLVWLAARRPRAVGV